jgi:hypothetical protein
MDEGLIAIADTKKKLMNYYGNKSKKYNKGCYELISNNGEIFIYNNLEKAKAEGWNEAIEKYEKDKENVLILD